MIDIEIFQIINELHFREKKNTVIHTVWYLLLFILKVVRIFITILFC